MGNETNAQKQEREALQVKEQNGTITDQEKQRLQELKANQ
jgi:hypothetical protein